MYAQGNALGKKTVAFLFVSLKKIQRKKSFLNVGMFIIFSLYCLNSSSQSQVGSTINGIQSPEQLGSSLSASNDGKRIILGSPIYSSFLVYQNGRASVYELINNVWTQIGSDIVGFGYSAELGYSVSISGDGTRVAVGAPSDDPGAERQKGYVKIFEYNAATNNWDEIGDLEGQSIGDFFGGSISLNNDGTIIAVGAKGNDSGGSVSGQVRIFQESGGVWTQRGADINGLSGEFSGRSVSLNSTGNYVAIGADGSDLNGTNSGVTRIYTFNGSSWTQVGGNINGDADDSSGWSVSINDDGTVVAIGAIYGNRNGGDGTGRARVYHYNGSSWTQRGLDINGDALNDEFGWSVSLNGSGDILAVGAPENDASIFRGGQAKILKYQSSGGWSEVYEFNGDADQVRMGLSVALSSDGNTAIIGIPHDDTNGGSAGAAKVYDLAALSSVTTSAATSISQTEANLGGEVTNEGFFDVTERGVVYSSVNSSPTIGGADVSQNSNGSGLGLFSETITGLTASTTYYYRAYATSSTGTSYGVINSFTTLEPLSGLYGNSPGDSFGYSVAINGDGTRLIAGATRDDNTGTNSGSARVFELVNGTWVQLGPDINGENAGDESGFFVSISDDGTRVAVSSIFNDGNGNNAGHVRIFEYNSGTNSWDQVGSDINGVAGDNLGRSVSLNANGKRVVVGANTSGVNGLYSGQVRIFEESAGVWSQLGSNINGGQEDQVGFSVDINDIGNYIVVGAVNNAENGTNSGQTKIYRYVLGLNDWVQVGNGINGEAAGDQSGWSVSISDDGTIVAIGARRNSPAGHARVYQYNGSTWNQLGSDLDGEASGEYFGFSLGLSGDGNLLVVGGHRNNGNTGHIRMYKYELNDWTQIGTSIRGDNGGDVFGHSVKISNDGNTIVVGAYGDDTNGTDAGKAVTLTYSHTTKLTTNAASSITYTSANLGGEVKNEGSSNVTERGIVYSSINTNPTIEGINVIKNSNGIGLGVFTETITGLIAGTTYYYRAYAINSGGTSYGNLRTVTTPQRLPQLDIDLYGDNIGDLFGYSVAINGDGTRLVAGAINDDNTGTNSGLARVFEWVNGTWVQLGQDINGENTGDQSGFFVSISDDGTRVAVSSIANDGNGNDAGHVRIFEYNSGTDSWDQVGSDINGVAGDNLGRSVSLNANGKRVVVGANFSGVNGLYSGQVRIFEESAGVWSQIGSNINGGQEDQVGFSVDINDIGNYIVVGAVNNAENGTNSGQTKIYRYVLGLNDWVQVGNGINGEAAGDQSGWSVSISDDGTIVAIGARRNSPAGHARVYQYNGSTWNQIGSDLDGEAGGEYFGFSLGLSGDGNLLVVGGQRNNGNTGHIRMYKYELNDWTQIGTSLRGDNGGDLFGFSVKISNDGNTIVVGSYGDDTNGTDAGKVSVYKGPIKPIVSSLSASNITSSSIDLGGEVTNEGFFDVTERGVVYSSVISSPTIGGADVNQNSNGNGLGLFSETITGLTASTTYYYRAYATNSGGTSYGNVLTATTTQVPQLGSDLYGDSSGDFFGYSVAINGNGTRLVAGATRDDNTGTNSGSARVFEWVNDAWVQLGPDINGENTGDESGFFVSISDDGTRVAVSSIYNDGNGNNAGHVRIFEYNSGTNSWDQVGSDIDGFAGDNFGRSVSLNTNGKRVVVGANFSGVNGLYSGQVRVFEESAGVWSQIGSNINGGQEDQLGFSVDINDIGNYIAIGAVTDNDNSGQTKIYQYDLGLNDWVQVGNGIYGEAAGDQSGWSVSISDDGTIVAIGARRNSPAGHARVYQYDGSSWNQLGSDLDGESNGEYFGFSLGLSGDGNFLVVGGYRNGSGGHIRIYKYQVNDWTQIGTSIRGDNAGDEFGFSVKISNDGHTIVVGAYRDDTNGTDAGKIEVHSILQQSLEVNTNDPISIASNYAYLGGEVVNNGVSTITERGIVYSTDNTNPFIGDTGVIKVIDNSGIDNYSQRISSLSPETIYYVKAYAINSEGARYGEVKSFLTGLPIQIGQEIIGSNSGDLFGNDVTINSDGTILAVVAPKNDTNGTDTGQITLYELVVDEWVQKGNKINGSSIQEALYNIDINSAGNIFSITTNTANSGGPSANGHVSVYEYQSGSNTWSQKGNAINTNASVIAKLSESGTKMIQAFDSSANGSFSTLIGYEFNGTDWVQFGNIIPNINTKELDINNDGMRIAAAYISTTSSNGNDSFVRVYEYNAGTNNWDQLGSDIEGAVGVSDFGSSLSLSGNGEYIALSTETNGTTLVYQFTDGQWVQIGSEISSSNGDTVKSVEINNTGNFLTIGYNDTDKGYTKAYVLSVGNMWLEMENLDIYGKTTGDDFGHAISLSDDGKSFAVGAPSQSGNGKGTIRVFEISGMIAVTTDQVTSTTATSAKLMGEVSSFGTTVTERGFVFSTNNIEPFIGNVGVTKISVGNGTGIYSYTKVNLHPMTSYYVRSYALDNEGGVSYGNTESFTTSNDLFNILHTTGFWNENNKWTYTRSPIESDNVLIAANKSANINTGDRSTSKLILDTGSSLTVNSGHSLRIDSSLEIKDDATLEIDSGGSLIVNGTSTGKITYKRFLPNDNWYMISTPFQGETLENFIGSNNLDSGNGYVGLISYNNGSSGYNGTGWEFYNHSSTGSMNTGISYGVRLPEAGYIHFTGDAVVEDINTNISQGTLNGYNLIGNPYPSYIPSNQSASANNLLDQNSGVLDEMTIWLWDNTSYSYIAINQATASRFIAPTQGYFVKSNSSGGTFNIQREWQSHQTDVFNRSHSNKTARPEIKLSLYDGTNTRSTDLFYIDQTTTGFDNGYDSTMFTILPNVSEIFTHLVSDSEGKNFSIQSLPNNNYEGMVVPIGVSAVSGKELVFTATSINFPSEIYVYLEDRETKTFTRLDEVGAKYRITLSEDISTVGRFYLHTNTSDVLSVNSEDQINISIYLRSRDLMNITGIHNQESKLKMYNIQGREVFATTFTGTGFNEIWLPNLRPGIYIVRLITQVGVVNKKLIIY